MVTDGREHTFYLMIPAFINDQFNVVFIGNMQLCRAGSFVFIAQ